MRLSRYCRTLEKDGVTAVFHALKPEPFFVDSANWNAAVTFDRWADDLREAMIEYSLLVENEDCDNDFYDSIKCEYVDIKTAPILYMVLTKHCNLSCRQCFQYERHQASEKPLPMMTKEIAKLGIDSFVRHMKRSDNSKQPSSTNFVLWRGTVAELGCICLVC